jgi:hypothetical protein
LRQTSEFIVDRENAVTPAFSADSDDRDVQPGKDPSDER